MDRRHFVKLALGLAAASVAVPAAAMPVMAPPEPMDPEPGMMPQDAVGRPADLEQALAEPVQWRRCWRVRGGWVCRRPGWRRRVWRRRWRRRYWY